MINNRKKYSQNYSYNNHHHYHRLLTAGKFWHHHWSWWVSKLAVLGFLALVIAIITLAVLIGIYTRDLPSPDNVVRHTGFATKILDRDGHNLYEVFEEQKRLPIEMDQIPEALKLATIAVEDKDFYKHQGFDVRGILRGIVKLFTTGHAQGGSTLTQQLVKNVLLTPERSITRKLKEFVLAVQIERKFSKDEILQMYLNESPYGGTAWGVQAGAETYFGKSASELNLTESIILSGLPQRPSYYSPFTGTRDAYIGRAEHVANRMYEDGYITAQEYEEVKTNIGQIKFATPDTGLNAPHFVAYVEKILSDRYGEATVEGGGLTVTTTLDLELQKQTQSIVTEEIRNVETLNITNGAAVVLDVNTGEILAMIGSKNYADPDYNGKFNVTTALRQPGSAIKPVTYVTAFKKGYTASTLIIDVPTEFPGGVGHPPYKPLNYDGKYRGPIQLRYALGNSINIPAVKMLSLVGIQDVLQTGYDMGLSTLEPTKENMNRLGLSMTLGGGEVSLLELADAYSAFANTGFKVEPIAILKVQDRYGNVLEEYQPSKGKRILTAEQTWLINDILSDNDARTLIFGSNSALQIMDRQIPVKTGTTNDQRDNWTIGWTPSYIVGVWVGNNDNSPMKKVASGVTGAAPIWRRIMLYILNKTDRETFAKPDSIVEIAVDKISGYQTHDGFESRTEFFIPGSQPLTNDPVHIKLKLCKGQDKLATPRHIANSDYDEKEFLIFKEEDPFFRQYNQNKWQEGILAWMTENPDGRYHPPSDYCDEGNPVAVNFLEPRNHDQVNSNKFKVKVDPVSTKSIKKIEIYSDDKLVSSISSPPWEDQVNVSDGTHKIQVKAWDEDNREGSATIEIGVNTPWDYQAPTSTPAATSTPEPSPTALPTSSPTP